MCFPIFIPLVTGPKWSKKAARGLSVFHCSFSKRLEKLLGANANRVPCTSTSSIERCVTFVPVRHPRVSLCRFGFPDAPRDPPHATRPQAAWRPSTAGRGGAPLSLGRCRRAGTKAEEPDSWPPRHVIGRIPNPQKKGSIPRHDPSGTARTDCRSVGVVLGGQ